VISARQRKNLYRMHRALEKRIGLGDKGFRSRVCPKQDCQAVHVDYNSDVRTYPLYLLWRADRHFCTSRVDSHVSSDVGWTRFGDVQKHVRLRDVIEFIQGQQTVLLLGGKPQ
jgi:hypothetical protein